MHRNKNSREHDQGYKKRANKTRISPYMAPECPKTIHKKRGKIGHNKTYDTRKQIIHAQNISTPPNQKQIYSQGDERYEGIFWKQDYSFHTKKTYKVRL